MKLYRNEIGKKIHKNNNFRRVECFEDLYFHIANYYEA